MLNNSPGSQSLKIFSGKRYNFKNYSAGNIASGIYIYRLSAESFVQEKRMVLMK